MSTYTKMSRRGFVRDGFCPTLAKNMCIYMGVRKSGPFVYRNQKIGPFIYFLFKKGIHHLKKGPIRHTHLSTIHHIYINKLMVPSLQVVSNVNIHITSRPGVIIISNCNYL